MARRGLYTDEEIAANQKVWLADLESGKLKQVNGELVGRLKSAAKRATYGYCCLGVGMRCLGYKRVPSVEFSSFDFGFRSGQIVETTSLSKEAADKLGLGDTTGTFSCTSLRKKNPKLVEVIQEKYLYLIAPGVKSSLASLNDANVPFKIIAEVIRSKPAGLFKRGKAFV